MKKTLLLVASISLLSLTSCFKKERVCTCISTNTDSQGQVTTGDPQVTTYKKIKKGDAKDHCVTTTYESTYTQGSSTGTFKSTNTCTLK